MAPSAALHDRLQDLSEHLGRRLVLTDERLRVVGYSIHESEADRARLSTVLAHSDSWPLPHGVGETVRDIPGHGSLRMVPLRDRDHAVGFLLVPTMPGEEELVGRARAVLAQHLPTITGLLSDRAARAHVERDRASALVRDLVGDDPRARALAGVALVEEGLLGEAQRYSAVALGLTPNSEGAVDVAWRAVDHTLEFAARTSTVSLAGGERSATTIRRARGLRGTVPGPASDVMKKE